MGFFSFFKRKKKTKETVRDIAKERMKNIVGARRNNIDTTLPPMKVNFEEISNMIKDYAQRKLLVSRNNVKVHFSKDDRSLTIVANIIYRR